MEALIQDDCVRRLCKVSGKRHCAPQIRVHFTVCNTENVCSDLNSVKPKLFTTTRIVKRQNLSPLQRPDKANFAFVSPLTDSNKVIIYDARQVYSPVN